MPGVTDFMTSLLDDVIHGDDVIVSATLGISTVVSNELKYKMYVYRSVQLV